jgi:DNA-binding transcriptional LysR family regulator
MNGTHGSDFWKGGRVIEFRYLPAFLAVAEAGSFTEAARALFIATSAVSRQVRLLEESCGVQLFFRTSRETTLTEAGRRLYEEMRHFRGRAEAIVGGSARGQLSIGTLQGVLHRWLIPLMAAEPYFAGSDVRIEVTDPDSLVNGVVSGTTDAAFFSFATLTHVPANLRIIRLFDEEIALISKARVPLRQVGKHPWISLGNVLRNAGQAGRGSGVRARSRRGRSGAPGGIPAASLSRRASLPDSGVLGRLGPESLGRHAQLRRRIVRPGQAHRGTSDLVPLSA